MSRLFNYAADHVPELARGVGGIQRPLIASPKGGASFDIGQLTAADLPKIPLASKRPVVLQTSFQEETTFRDVLQLGKQVDELLRQASSQATVAAPMYVDAREFPGGFEVAGRYRTANNQVTVTVKLYVDRKPAGSFSTTGPAADIESLARRIVASLESTPYNQVTPLVLASGLPVHPHLI